MSTPYRPARIIRTHVVALVSALVAAGAFTSPVSVAPVAAQETHGAHGGVKSAADGADQARVIPGLGNYRRRIGNATPQAQAWFNQGLQLAYAFNHAEALLSFREAARLDPRCAMCEWGIAYVLGPNINAPMDTAAYAAAHAAVTRARGLVRDGNVFEGQLIKALSERYTPSAPAGGRAALDSAYASAMREVAARWRDDADAATLHAESVMLLSPWTYWSADAKPLPGTPQLLSSLERAMRIDRKHPGACHYFIHAVEAAFPERALPCAERLAALMPGAGHIVHMPGHIYLRVGRYNDAIKANEHAVHADEAYLADAGARAGFYAVAYYPHNLHFLGFAATMAGRTSDALKAARLAATRIPADAAEGAPELQLLVAYPHLTLTAFGRWDEAAREPLPAPALRVATALAWYGRGVAAARTGHPAAASAALDTVRTIGSTEARYPVAPVLTIARLVLESEIAAATGQRAVGIERLKAAVLVEDSLTYMEPPYWSQPVRQLLGSALVAAGRPAEAEGHFRADLRRFPDNVWSLSGLAQSLVASGKVKEAEEVRSRLRTVTRNAETAKGSPR
ncbi:MAG: tetratricopeptide repeat protein [Gemmatimonadota bacterium]